MRHPATKQSNSKPPFPIENTSTFILDVPTGYAKSLGLGRLYFMIVLMTNKMTMYISACFPISVASFQVTAQFLRQLQGHADGLLEDLIVACTFEAPRNRISNSERS